MFPGDSLYAESKVLDKRESASKLDRGIVAIETRGFNQNASALSFCADVIWFPREA
jgi:acyl dehydratase